jgi:hypothetical protein
MRSLLLISLLSLGAVNSSAQALGAPAALVGKTMPAQAAAQSNQASGSQPSWKQLSPVEQTALRPLAANWDRLSLGQKRKWQNVAKDFDKLPAAQQAKMHTRMTEWTALSPKQRADARINFAQNRELTDGLTPEQRKVQWQAYQQLSPEEKRKLAESAPKASIAGAAPAARPQPVLKKEPAPEFGTGKVLANAKAVPAVPAPGKRIAVAPHVAAQGSVLPGHPGDAPIKP